MGHQQNTAQGLGVLIEKPQMTGFSDQLMTGRKYVSVAEFTHDIDLISGLLASFPLATGSSSIGGLLSEDNSH